MVRAAVAIDILPLLEHEARKRMEAGVNQYSLTEIFPEASAGESRDKAGEMFGVSSERLPGRKCDTRVGSCKV